MGARTKAPNSFSKRSFFPSCSKTEPAGVSSSTGIYSPQRGHETICTTVRTSAPSARPRRNLTPAQLLAIDDDRAFSHPTGRVCAALNRDRRAFSSYRSRGEPQQRLKLRPIEADHLLIAYENHGRGPHARPLEEFFEGFFVLIHEFFRIRHAMMGKKLFHRLTRRSERGGINGHLFRHRQSPSKPA